MAFDITPNSFWNFPALRKFPLWDEDDEFSLNSSSPSGLTLSEDDKYFCIDASIPGINPDEVEVTVHKGIVWIKAESKREDADKNKKFYRRATRSFSYRVAIPGEIDQKTEPKAVSKNGVMTITFTKVPQEQPKKIHVKEV